MDEIKSHIPNKNGKPICGKRGKKLKLAKKINGNMCAMCLEVFCQECYQRVMDSIKHIAPDWTAFLLLYPFDDRDKEMGILLKSLEIEIKRQMEVNSHG